MKPVLFSAVAFAIAGAVCRHTFQDVFTRLQILAFWVAAAAIGTARLGATKRYSAKHGVAINGLAATTAILAMKWHLEGFHLP